MNPNGNVKLTGMVSGGAGGMGLGMLAAGLMGVNPLWGFLEEFPELLAVPS